MVSALERRRRRDELQRVDADVESYAPLADDAEVSLTGRAAPDARPKASLVELVRSLPRSYWLYAAAGACVYGAIVPWLVAMPRGPQTRIFRAPQTTAPAQVLGAKLLQRKYGVSLALADRLMLMPEAAIVVFCPPLGIAVDRRRPHVRRKLRWAALGALAFPLSLGVVALGARLPVAVPTAALAVGWSVFNTMFFRRADVSTMNRGDAAAATWTFRWKEIAATPRPRRGHFVETNRGDAAAASWTFRWKEIAATPRP